MAEIGSDQSEINARIVYWGIPGAGISANLAMIHGKLKGDNRGALRRIPTRIDPTVEYEVLPIELGEVNGASSTRFCRSSWARSTVCARACT
ncbi:MAG: hypothetical protein JRE71_19340 [Deltaproteobacteria bacterium]|nr:hypothetical protein [Deltaproteobacteria bacterium]